ncbi:MAG: peptidylprolyl isomerase [Clostridia bacterium]|nr:peptidylprolyl isomerase [Clostridia bacterium]
MKMLFKRILMLTLSCLLIVMCLTGCSSRGKKLMEIENTDMTVNMYMLLLSRMKGKLSSSYAFGSQALKDNFWDIVMDASTGQTYDDYYTDMVLENAKTYLASLYLFDELDLKLPSETMDEIDAELQRLVDEDGEGSKNTLNTILAEYGANYKILREAYIMEAKIAYLSDYLFGVDGELISTENYEKYYQENYVRFRHIFFFTTKPVYQTDANGDTIYYSDLSSLTVAYDKNRTGAENKRDADGEIVKDSKGYTMWFYTDEEGNEHISYDETGTTEAPTYPNPILDKDGNVLTTELSTEEHIRLSDKVQLIMEEQAREGEFSLFDKLVEQYGEDKGMTQYPGGYYLTRSSDYDSPEVVKALFEMNTGEIRRIESDYGIHIVMKYELPEGGYAAEENADFFVSEDGTYSFMTQLRSDMLDSYVEKYKIEIVVDEERLKGITMKSVGANYYY